MSFEDIAIVDLDLAKTTWSRVHSSMRTLYLRLSREPETGWVRFFHEERESRIVIKRHGFWIEDGYIVFDCLLEDVERYHLPDFRQSLEYANEKYRAWLAQQFEQGLLLREDARSERAELAALRERIRLDATVPGAPDAPLPLAGTAATTAVPSAIPVESNRVPTRAAAAGAPLAADRPSERATEAALLPAPSLDIASSEAQAAQADSPSAVETPLRRNGLAARVAELLRNVAGAPAAPAVAATVRRAGAANEPAAVTSVAASAPESAAPAPEPVPSPEPAPPPRAIAAPIAESIAESIAEPTAAPAAAPAGTTPAATDALEAGFNAKREEWRARFRAALAAKSKEHTRGND